MFGDGSLTFQEFAMGESLPLATIHDAVLEFLRGREDAAIFGAQAVNAYIDEPRMTQDVDILSPCAAELAEQLRAALNERFHIAVRIREVKQGIGYRLYQTRKPKNRHLVDVRTVDRLPPCNIVDGVLVPTPAVLICQKVLSMVSRPNTRKGLMDAADLRGMLVRFPKLKSLEGPVADVLRAAEAPEKAQRAWRDFGRSRDHARRRRRRLLRVERSGICASLANQIIEHEPRLSIAGHCSVKPSFLAHAAPELQGE